MDFIKKTICLEEARTRTQGLMPYYAFGEKYEQHNVVSGYVGSLELSIAIGENGNWGQFVANPWFLGENNKTYEAMLRKYYDLLNMVREGVKLRKVETKEGEIIFTEDISAFEWNGECFDNGEEPESLYEYAAYDAEVFTSIEIESLRDETRNIYRTNIDVPESFVVLIKDFVKFAGTTEEPKTPGLQDYLDEVSIPPSVTTHTIEDNIHTKWADYCQIVDDLIGKINIPASIYNKHIKVPKSMPCVDVQPYIDWLKNYPKEDCCNARLYEDMGGDEMLEELENHTGECANKLNALNNLPYSIPYIEMPILLTQSYTDIGVLTNIDGVGYENDLTEEERPHGIGSPTGLTTDEILMCNGETVQTHPTTKEFETNPSAYTDDSGHTIYPIEVESLLQTLRNKKKYTDDKDNVLPGDFQKFAGSPAGKMFKCEKNDGEWIMSETSDNVINGDGKTSEECKGTNYYRTITTCAAGKRIAETVEEENGQSEVNNRYYFLVKYDNSSGSVMTMPYKVGNTTNVYLISSGSSEDEDWFIYRGDFIVDLTANSRSFEIKYVVGGYFSGDTNGNYLNWVHQESGDVYYEKYDLDRAHVDYVALDGVDKVPVWSNYIDFDGAVKEFYSTRYGLVRTGNTANIIRFTSGEVWQSKSTALTPYDAYLVKEEYLTGVSLPPKTDVNVTVDRGGVSAFEKHYKLSECNTMQDLMRYNNSEFFPEI